MTPSRGFAAMALLGLPTLAYGGAVRLRNRFYDRDGAARRGDLPVLSIGNLTVGGTGKTPMVAWLVRFLQTDATKVRLKEATVLALYLLPESLETLAPLFERDLRPRTRIVSHNYRITGWDARHVLSETQTDERGYTHMIHLYRMPGPS